MAKDIIKKYSPDGARAMQDNEDEMNARGKSAVKNYKEGNVGKAAVDVAKGIGTAAKNLAVTSPLAGVDAIQKRMAFGAKNDDEMPSDIADKLQDMKNQKGAADYEKNKTYKKGGKTTAKCMARGGGIEIRGKTKGRFV